MFKDKMKELSGLKNKVWGTTGSGPRPTDDLTPPTKDALFTYQLSQEADPMALTWDSLMWAKICETHTYAKDVFSTLHKTGIIDSTGRPDTTRIDKSLVNKIAIISVPKQRELVNMLFFWEEECTRWRILDDEAAEIRAHLLQLQQRGGVEDEEDTRALYERLAVLDAQKRVLPSLRRADGSVKEHALPEYREA